MKMIVLQMAGEFAASCTVQFFLQTKTQTSVILVIKKTCLFAYCAFYRGCSGLLE